MSTRAMLAAQPGLRRAATGLLRGTQRVRRRGLAERPVLINSVPKAGTHLAGALVETAHVARHSGRTLIGQEVTANGAALSVALSAVHRGFYAPGHIPFSLEASAALGASGAASLFVVREPRAIAASHAAFVMQRRHHSLHDLYAGMSSPAQRIKTSILGTSYAGFTLPALADRLQAFSGWLDDAATLVVRFEDLVGATGGGSDSSQSTAVEKIATHCGVPQGSIPTHALTRAHGRRSSTFSQGTTDGWRRAFDDELLELVEREVGELSRRFGYR